ncbi:hypothetical protein U1Q18_039702, partial [Sarracenia purpurea var. burkii]
AFFLFCLRGEQAAENQSRRTTQRDSAIRVAGATVRDGSGAKAPVVEIRQRRRSGLFRSEI